MKGSPLTFFAAGACAVLVAAAAIHLVESRASAASAGGNVLLSPEDYIEISQIYGMYARDVDPGSARDPSWMFTNDAIVVMDDFATLTTPEEIKTFYAEVPKAQSAGVRHFNTSYVIVGTADGGARGSSYMMELQTKTEGGNPEVMRFGKYEDKLVKTTDGWRIKERVWRADTFRGSNKSVMASPVPGNRATDATGALEARAAKMQAASE